MVDDDDISGTRLRVLAVLIAAVGLLKGLFAWLCAYSPRPPLEIALEYVAVAAATIIVLAFIEAVGL